MAAIPDAGGARHAPRGVMCALIRLVVLGGLVVAGWLLGSGTSHADEDQGGPGAGLIHLVSAASADGSSDDQFGVSPSVEPVIHRMPLAGILLPNSSRRPVQPPVRVRILPAAVNALNAPEPLAKTLPIKVLEPVSRPLLGPLLRPAPPRAAVELVPQADRPATVPPAAPTVAARGVAVPPVVVATRPPAVPALIPVRSAAPAVSARSPAAQPPADPLLDGPAISDNPVTPIPVSPPGDTPSPSLIGGAGGATSTKNAPDAAVRESWAMGILTQARGVRSRHTSDPPRSLSTQPSTSPD